MAGLLRRLASYLHEQVVERVESPVSGTLEVWLAYGRLELNAKNVNYSFGELHKVFRDAFSKLQIAKRNPKSVLLLGLGAGSVVKLLREAGVNAPITAVELDPVVVTLGNKHFGLGEISGLEIVEGVDATEWLPSQQRTFDLVIVDLFVDEKVPASADSPAFFAALKNVTNPGGMLLWNRLAFRENLETESNAFFEKIGEALPDITLLPVRGNRMLIWRKA